jgi:hypothetical protein
VSQVLLIRIVGAMAASLMLFGMAFIYGATGEVRFGYEVDGQLVSLSSVVANLDSGMPMTALFGFTVLLDPLTCRRCGVEMPVISVITEGAVIDQLLRHVRQKTAGNGDEPFDARSSKAPGGPNLTGFNRRAAPLDGRPALECSSCFQTGP